MNFRRHLLEALTLVIAAVLCAATANLFASRERKIAFVGDYPNALTVPKRESAPPVPEPQPVAAAAIVPPAETAPVPSSPGVPAAAPAGKAGALDSQPQHSPKSAPPAAQASAAAAAPVKVSDVEILTRFPVHEGAPFREISAADAEWLYRQGVLFFDARRTSVYEEGHIAGARSFPVWESDVDQKVAALTTEGLDPKKPIVVYCSGGDCEDSHMLAQKLWGAFFNNALVYKDGFPDWKKRGNPIRAGSQP